MCALHSQSCQGMFKCGRVFCFDVFWLQASGTCGTVNIVNFLLSEFYISVIMLCICPFVMLASNAWVSVMNEAKETVLWE